MNRHSIEIARHAERVRRYERKLKIRARKREFEHKQYENRLRRDFLSAKIQAMQNVNHAYAVRDVNARERYFWGQFGL